ncbi:hypothetical protein MED01_002445 [Micromonospora sp. MED01]|uniref:hypothetical protein n=1 Tax=Micromonospora alfalfae TaxID=2911212 RepID=UPI001EE7BD5E|nr:hypothetical protein [Micromonospora alfalfae]MCG5464279.1 hypothetical protein [Micromonospora alfalfae]
MTAPQRVDPARIRKANRAQTIAGVATVAIWIGLFAVVGGLFTATAALWWVGLMVGVPAVAVSIVGGHLAGRYREPVTDGEVQR